MSADPKARMLHATKRRLGFAGYCRILSAVISRPGTTAQLAERMGVTHNTMAYVMRSLYRMGLVYRSEWVRPVPHSILVPVWKAGRDGIDTEPEIPAPRKHKRAARGSAITLGTIAQILADEPLRMTEIAEELGLHRETTVRLIGIMREYGLCRIAAWEPREKSGAPIPLYAFGRGGNKPKPEPRIGRCPELAKKHKATYQAKRRHEAMLKALSGPTSVFAWGGQTKVAA